MKINEIDNREQSRQHADALEKTGFWGKQGAGCIFYAQDTGRFCIAHRSRRVQEPNTWGTWGGAIDNGEDPAAAVKREVAEEAGYTGPVKLVHLWTFKHQSGFQYHNFLAIVNSEFTPQMDWENQGFDWVKFGDWPRPLHPGLAHLINSAGGKIRELTGN